MGTGVIAAVTTGIRSTRAGIGIPESRRNGLFGSIAIRGPHRSTKAGIGIPAKQGTGPVIASARLSAQQRPEWESRRNPAGVGVGMLEEVPSTKAGIGIPAKLDGQERVCGAGVPRSTKAGIGIPAKLVTAVQGTVISGRSTKAGIGIPAKRGRWPATARRTTSLNKGRNRNPGETRYGRGSILGLPPALNKGRNRNPGETPSRQQRSSAVRGAQQRPE